MVQLDMNDLNLISRTIEMVKNRGISSFSSATSYNSTSGSPSKSAKPKHLIPLLPSAASHSTSSSSSSVPASNMISYPMIPTPPSPQLVFPCGCCIRWFCGGNMKWVAFPMLCAVSLGLFLAFSKAVTIGYGTDRAYSPYLNSRQLSEDEPDLMPKMPGLFGHKFDEHHFLMAGHPGMGMQGRGGGAMGGQCDCSICEQEQEIYYPTETKYRKLVKHSLQHFYGRRELALNIASFVPFKQKLWHLGFALYTTASGQCEGLAQPLAVVLVTSVARHNEERQAIRRTWGSLVKENSWPNRRIAGDVRVIFVLGVSKIQDDNEMVTQEAEKHGDVILVDIPEEPENLSKKVLSGFKWVQMYCRQAQYVIKVNEDVFVDLPRLLQQLTNQEMASMIYGPIVISQRVPREVTRTNELAVDPHSYFPDWFPPYAEGYFYAMPTQLSQRLVEVAEFLPYVGLEDVFITGIVAKVFDTRHINVPEALFERKISQQGELCSFVFQSKMAVKGVTPEMAISVWRRIQHPEMCGFAQGSK